MSESISFSRPPDVLPLMAHEVRWRVLSALARSDYRVQELVRLLGERQNLVSYHLKRLRDAQLVKERRSTADGRDTYYSIDLQRLKLLYSSAGEALHPSLSFEGHNSDGRGERASLEDKSERSKRTLPPSRVLFLCTHNSARSQMAEALTRHYGGDAVEVYSAGTAPSGIHQCAVAVLAQLKIDVSQARSKHLDEYRGGHFDYIITVCDRVKEVCPLFPGDPEHIHWSFPDPSSIEDPQEQYEAFVRVAQELTTRIRFLLLVIENEKRNKGRGV